jgi:hypothetical protein
MRVPVPASLAPFALTVIASTAHPIILNVIHPASLILLKHDPPGKIY